MKLVKELIQLNEDKQYPEEMSKELAKEGADIAERLQDAGRRWDNTNSKQVDLHILRKKKKKFVKKGGPKIADEIKKVDAEHAANSKEYDVSRKEADAFEKKNGFGVIYAWEAAHQKPWPYYKVWPGAGTKTGSKVKLV